MNEHLSSIFNLYGIFSIVFFVCAFYCMMATKNLIRAIIGLELLTKAVTLFIVVAGHISNQMALAQSLAISVIIIEVIVVPLSAGLILGIFRKNNSLGIDKIRNLRG
ncbi:MAG: NADH-quinone oxidoreductase subunit K [Candidatus Riflebacteria bacterium]|nr:NADH-quinone oxidoreductase subunit K [Candidatus Riflebacteria bacterium]